MFKKIKKLVTVFSLVTVLSVPVFASAAYETSASNTITTNKNSWTTSMNDTKVTNTQQTSVQLFSGKGHGKAINYVRFGALIGNSWTLVTNSGYDGYRVKKDDDKHDWNLTTTVNVGTQMRVRMKLGSDSENSAFSTDTVAHAWWWN